MSEFAGEIRGRESRGGNRKSIFAVGIREREAREEIARREALEGSAGGNREEGSTRGLEEIANRESQEVNAGGIRKGEAREGFSGGIREREALGDIAKVKLQEGSAGENRGREALEEIARRKSQEEKRVWQEIAGGKCRKKS